MTHADHEPPCFCAALAAFHEHFTAEVRAAREDARAAADWDWEGAPEPVSYERRRLLALTRGAAPCS